VTQPYQRSEVPITFLLILILLVLVFGSGWLRGVLRAICMVGAGAVALGLLVRVIEVEPSTVIYAGFGLLGVFAILDSAARQRRRSRLARRAQESRKT